MKATQFLRLLQDGLETVSALTPDKAAVVVEGDVHRYSELQNSSSCLANALVERGLKPGQRVAIFEFVRLIHDKQVILAGKDRLAVRLELGPVRLQLVNGGIVLFAGAKGKSSLCQPQ